MIEAETAQKGEISSPPPWWQSSLGCLSYSCYCSAPFVQCEYLEREPEVILPQRWDQTGELPRQPDDGSHTSMSGAWDLEDAPHLPGYDEAESELRRVLQAGPAGSLSAKQVQAYSNAHLGILPQWTSTEVQREPPWHSCLPVPVADEPSAQAGTPKKSSRTEWSCKVSASAPANSSSSTLFLAAATERSSSSRSVEHSPSLRSASTPANVRAPTLMHSAASLGAAAGQQPSELTSAPALASASAPDPAAAAAAAASEAAAVAAAAGALAAEAAAEAAAVAGAVAAAEARNAAADAAAAPLTPTAAAELAKDVVRNVLEAVSAKLTREAERAALEAEAEPASPPVAAARTDAISPEGDAATASPLGAGSGESPATPLPSAGNGSGDAAANPAGPATPAPPTRSTGSAISARLKAYQAACQSPAKQPAPPQSLQTKVNSRSALASLRTRTATLSSQWPTRKLKDVRLQQALKRGIAKLDEELSKRTGGNLEELPEQGEGRPKMLGRSFLKRLLSGELELKACTENDAASAQMDLKHLRTEQLIAIRSRTLDLATESATHSARTNFLETADRHLYEKLTRQCLLGSSVSLPAKPEVLHALGLRLSLVVGVVEMLSIGKADGNDGRELPPAPNCWALRLEAADWPEGCSVALFKVRELLLQPLLGERPDFAGLSCGQPVAIVRDQSFGIGKDRMLHWEIAAVDPKTADVLEEMDKLESKANGSQLANELADVLAQRERALSVEDVQIVG